MLLIFVKHLDVSFTEDPFGSFGNRVSVGHDGMLAFLDDDPSQNLFIYLQVVVEILKSRGLHKEAHLPHRSLYTPMTERGMTDRTVPPKQDSKNSGRV